MLIVAKDKLADHATRRPDSRARLETWLAEAEEAIWKTPGDIKARYPTASFLGDNRVIFHIGGNKYRLIVRINYKIGVVQIRFVGTHGEYDKINAENI